MADPEEKDPEPTNQFSDAVGDLVEQIKSQSAELKAERAASAVPVTPAKPAEPDLTPERLDELADPEKGGSFGAAMTEIGNKILAPMVGSQINTAKVLRRELIEQHREVGDYAKAHREQIDATVKARGVTDQAIVETGYEQIVRDVMASDPELQKETQEAAVAAAVEAKLKELGIDPENRVPTVTQPQATPVQRPSAPAIGAPTPAPNPTRDQAIAAVQVSAEEAQEGAKYWHMKPEEIQKQRYEIAQLYEKHGERGIKNLGGVPVCDLTEVGLKEME